jgi:hypothetical protein
MLPNAIYYPYLWHSSSGACPVETRGVWRRIVVLVLVRIKPINMPEQPKQSEVNCSGNPVL